jgi:hypothetical protein
MENRIIICKSEIDTYVNTVFNEKTLRNDDVLIESILKFSNKIKENGGEIFKHEKNIIATNEGYFFAYYENELNVI